MSRLFKRTKILATIGPSVFTQEKIEELIMAGVNGCRLNFSHGSYEERDQQIKWIRDAAAKKGRSVAILQDLQGPKIRLGELKDNHFDVKAGDELILDSSIEKHDGTNMLPVQYNLAERMKVGEPLFMFDGKIKSEVVEIVSKTAIKVKVLNDGFLMSKKGLNLPDTDFGGDVITEKDMADIEFGASRDFDYVAMSFVQSAEDIDKLRQIMLSHGSTAQIIAKIETKKAIESDEKMEAIVKATDGIMVARGDMAVEAGNEVVPIVQRKLIALCRQYGKIVIVATQMMGSMVENPEPSRAEVSDVANAVIQGADAVMLSDETANGKYPVEAVKQITTCPPEEYVNLHNSSLVRRTKSIKLPHCGYVIDFGLASCYDYLYGLISVLNEYREANMGDDDIRNILITLVTTVRGIRIPQKDGKYIKFTDAKDIIEIMARQIPPQDMQVIYNIHGQFLERYEIEFNIRDIKCPHCGAQTKSIPMTPDELVFLTHQRMLNTPITLDNFLDF